MQQSNLSEINHQDNEVSLPSQGTVGHCTCQGRRKGFSQPALSLIKVQGGDGAHFGVPTRRGELVSLLLTLRQKFIPTLVMGSFY